MKRPFPKGDERLREENRFFMEELPLSDGEFELTGDEAAHMAGSRRMRSGDAVTLFDGSGWDVNATVVEGSARRVTLTVTSRVHVGAPTTAAIVCATALPKGAREDLLVSKCAELGVARLVPVEFERSVVHAEERWEKRKARFRRLAIEAAKQSGASTLMEIGDPVALSDAIAARRGAGLIGVPTATRGVLDALEAAYPFTEAILLVGPEGGTTAREESAAAEAGFVPVVIAATVLRIETACLAFAAVAAAFIAGRESSSAG
jgi:16S rRNA (uracil1498-N3)-methyltransferase